MLLGWGVMGMGEMPPCVARMVRFPPYAIGTRGLPPVHWNMMKLEEPEQYEAHYLWEMYDHLKVESRQPFYKLMVFRE